MFNIHFNDLVLKVQNVYDGYYVADPNTSGVSKKSGEEVCLNTTNLTQDMLPWFTENWIEARPSKFKFMFFFQ